ncbi:MAG: NAD(P)H-binding protein, partial [Bacillus sp. (in: firmicutes)]
MNICLFGATGRVGSIILENALSNQHSVRVLVRDRNKLNYIPEELFVMEGNVLNETDIAESLSGS